MAVQDNKIAHLPQSSTDEIVKSSELIVSVIMPCLNEEATVGDCARKSLAAISDLGLTGEVIVVDNGSTDNSVAVALKAGARVLSEKKRGYGNTCRRGFAEARGDVLVLGDADGTYDFTALGGFVRPLLNGSDVVIGTRLKGAIESGAMPWLHRYVGNPLLTKILNGLTACDFSDAHCGLRSIKRDRYLELNLESTGMEFASEFLIAASNQGLTIEEIPVVYHRRGGGEPKLRTFRDGWRHLRLMIASRQKSASSHAHHPSGVSDANRASGGLG